MAAKAETKRGPFDFKRARVLICNDDGIHGPGLKVLEAVAREIAREVWVVAPETEQSASSHSLTLLRPLRIREISKRRYAVDGTPTDCVMLAGNLIMRDQLPDIVLSGVNRGGNLGDDVTYSGTVAAAMEATILGIRAVALSQLVTPNKPIHWATAERWAPKVLTKLSRMRWPKGMLVNVNFPDAPARSVTGIEVAPLGWRKIGDDVIQGTDPRSVPYYWIGGPRAEDRFRRGTDLEAAHRGAVVVTPLTVNLTHRGTLRTLKALFK